MRDPVLFLLKPLEKTLVYLQKSRFLLCFYCFINKTEENYNSAGRQDEFRFKIPMHYC